MADGGFGWALVQMLVALAVVCGGAYLVLRFGVGRLLGVQGRGPISVRARCALDPRRSVYLVETAGRCFLIGSAEQGLVLLAEVDPARLSATDPARIDSPAPDPAGTGPRP